MATPVPPRRRPTMVDVAARAGVSRALASLVLRDQPGASAETRARVLAVAAELGYRPDSAARLENPDLPPGETVLTPELVIRGTTAQPPGEAAR